MKDIELQDVVLKAMYEWNRKDRSGMWDVHDVATDLEVEDHGQMIQVMQQLARKGLVDFQESFDGGAVAIDSAGIELIEEDDGQTHQATQLYDDLLRRIGTLLDGHFISLSQQIETIRAALDEETKDDAELRATLPQLVAAVQAIAAHAAKQDRTMTLMHETVNEVFAKLTADEYKTTLQKLATKGLLEGVVSSLIATAITAVKV